MVESDIAHFWKIGESENTFWELSTFIVMTEARDAAQMTRGLADIVDTRGNDFLDLMSTFSSEGKK